MKLNCLARGSRVSRMRVVLAAVLLASVGAAVLCLGTRVNLKSDSEIASAPGLAFGTKPQPSQKLQTLSSRMPLVFEANQGQIDSRVKFLSRGLGYGLFLTADEAVLEMQHSSVSHQHSGTQDSVVRMRLVGAKSTPQISGIEPLPGKSNYFIGNDPTKWRRNIPQFGRVRYHDVYSGIDLVYYGKQGQLEYDFEVAAGADPGQVVLRFDAPEAVKLNPAGDLLLATQAGSVRLQAPRIYQKRGQQEQPVPGRFVMRAKNQVGFEIGAYDRSRELIIDPQLSYSTYLGGSGSEGCFAVIGTATAGCPAIAADPGGTAFYITGPTTSANFPTSSGVLQGTLAAGATANIFVTKINPNITTASSQVVFSTYVGGNGTDYPVGIAVDSGFNVYVAGTTTSSNFPPGQITPIQSTAAGKHVFVSQLRSDGAQLLYSTYLSGNGTDIATGMAIDNKGSAFVTGTTTSTDFPVSKSILPFQAMPALGATGQFFVSKVSTLASNSGMGGLLYSTYFGGSNPATGAVQGGGIAVDTNGNAYITGTTNFLHLGNSATDFPIVNGFQACLDTAPPATPPTTPPPCPTNVTAKDAFVAKFNPTVSGQGSLVYSTYLGGSGDDEGFGIAVDSGFNAYVTGSTNSPDFVIPTSIQPYQRCLDSPTTTTSPCPAPTAPIPTDAFVAKIGGAPISTTNPVFPLNYFTYLGGSGTDVGLAIAVDSIQNVRVGGSTNSSADFPVTPNPIQPGGFGGMVDAFVARIDTSTNITGRAGEWAAFLGGSGTDDATGIAVDTNGTTYVTGDTNSGNFPVTTATATTTPALQPTINGPSDVFISKIVGVSALDIPPVFPPNTTTANPAVSPSPVGSGNQVTFTYNIVNNGPDPATNVIVTDVLPPGATFDSATASPGSCIATPVNGVETCAMGSLPVTPTGATTANTIKINLTPTAPGSLGDTISVTANGLTNPVPAHGSVTVTDFQIGTSPSTFTVTAGQPASYQVTVTPLPTYSGQVSLSCSSGLPSQATCAFSTTPVSFTNSGAVQSTLTINTVARPVVTTHLRRGAPLRYAAWLPISGLALLGLGIGSRDARRRKLLGGFLFAAVLGLTVLQPACGSSNRTTTPPTGTPAGTYAVTVTGSSGMASHTSTVTLVVQ